MPETRYRPGRHSRRWARLLAGLVLLLGVQQASACTPTIACLDCQDDGNGQYTATAGQEVTFRLWPTGCAVLTTDWRVDGTTESSQTGAQYKFYYTFPEPTEPGTPHTVRAVIEHDSSGTTIPVGSNTISVNVTAGAFTVNILPSAGCTVMAGDGGVDDDETEGNGIVCSGETTDDALCTEQYANDNIAALKVVPDAGYVFTGWTVNGAQVQTVAEPLFLTTMPVLAGDVPVIPVANQQTDCQPRCSKEVHIDLDIDSNMDGNPDNDESVEIKPRGIIINVNNDSDIGDGTIDNQNDTIDGSSDKSELTPLWLRKTGELPDGYKVILSVFGTAGLRIFDDTGMAVIGPGESWGGPDDNEYLIPIDKITVGGLKYLIEGCNYGSAHIRLALLDTENNTIKEDAINVVVNVDRLPGEATTFGFYRNYVGVVKQRANLTGVEAKLEGDKPLVSWGIPRGDVGTSVSYWINIGDNIQNAWLQTGNVVEKRPDGSEEEYIYFEFVSDLIGYAYGTDPNGYIRFHKEGSQWDDGKFKIEVSDKAAGEVKVFFNDELWGEAIHENFQTILFTNYQVKTEPKETVSRISGTASNRAKVSEIRFKDHTNVWHPTNFSASNLMITVVNGKGEKHIVGPTNYGNSGHFFEYNFNWLSGQSFEIWDNRSW